MVNDPKSDKDLENKDISEGDEASTTDEGIEEVTDTLSESDEADTEEVDSSDAEHFEEFQDISDDVEDAVLVDESGSSGLESDDMPEAVAENPATVDHKDGGGGSAIGMIFGGLIAGGIGFLIATFAVPEGWPHSSGEQTAGGVQEQLATASGRLDEQVSRANALQDEIEALKAILNTMSADTGNVTSVDVSPLQDAMSALNGDVEALSSGASNVAARLGELDASLGDSQTLLSALQESLGSLEQRLVVLEERPIALAPDGSGAMEAQLQAFREELNSVTAAARAEIEASQERANLIEAEALAAAAAAAERAAQLESEAAAAEALAKKEAAISQVNAALESGGGFAEALKVMPQVPEALSTVADEGVATLASLQAAFPEAARVAISMEETIPEDSGAGDRLVAFFKRQTNARSLEPRDGGSADAVLSRAEAALSAGDLSTALSELEALSEGPMSAMSSWVEDALKRDAALSAAATLESATN